MKTVWNFIKRNKVLLFLIALFFLYGFNNILLLGPYGIHTWRQADCLSITDNYFTNGLSFWEPEIHNFISDGKTSGKSAGEFPILYYLIALLWEIFGKSEGIYRIVVLSLNVTGFYYLYKILKDLFTNKFWALCITLCFFSTPILLFYGSSFLTNVPAFSLVLIGWYHFNRFYKEKKMTYLYFSLFFFVIAGLLKITAFISAIAILGLLGIELIRSFFKIKPQVFHSILKSFIPFVLAIILLVLWYKFYIDYYTDLHHGKYTFNDFWPIWEMKPKEVSKAWNFFLGISSFQYLNPLMWVIFIVGLLLSLFGFKHIGKGYSIIVLAILVGTTIYTLCWFNALHYHDYYLINLIILPLISIIGLALFIKSKWSNWFDSNKAKWIVGIVTVFSICYGANNLRMRYSQEMDYWKGFSIVFNTRHEAGFWYYGAHHRSGDSVIGIESYLKGIGIDEKDLVICGSDPSFCIELYTINRKGWTGYNLNNDYNNITKLKDKGAKYLIITNPDHLKKEKLKPFIQEKIGQINKVSIFKL